KFVILPNFINLFRECFSGSHSTCLWNYLRLFNFITTITTLVAVIDDSVVEDCINNLLHVSKIAITFTELLSSIVKCIDYKSTETESSVLSLYFTIFVRLANRLSDTSLLE